MGRHRAVRRSWLSRAVRHRLAPVVVMALIGGIVAGWVILDRSSDPVTPIRSNSSAPPVAVPRAAVVAAPATRAVGVNAFGDSVTLAAESSLERAIPGIVVDAVVGRQVGVGISQLIESLNGRHVGGTVVFALGTNGPFSTDQFDELVRLTQGRHLVVVTSHCPYCGWIDANNAMVHARCGTAQHCTVADWAALADQNPQWFVEDGVHIPAGGDGTRAFAGVIAAAL